MIIVDDLPGYVSADIKLSARVERIMLYDSVEKRLRLVKVYRYKINIGRTIAVDPAVLVVDGRSRRAV